MNKRIYLLLFMLAGLFNFSYAATESNSSNVEPYIGINGGYLFKNQKINDHPTWHLKDGFFGEINGGFKKDFWGWSGSLGYLQMYRDVNAFEGTYLNANSIYNTHRYQLHFVTDGNLYGEEFYLDPSHNRAMDYTNFRSYYLLTGPNFWIGKNKLKLNIALEGGIGLSKVGYWAIAGNADQGDRQIDFEGRLNAGSTTDNYEMGIHDIDYRGHSMSKKFHDKINGTPNIFSHQQNEDFEVHFVGRASANLEYFVHPKVSLHAGANIWAIVPPHMVTESQAEGIATYTDSKGNVERERFLIEQEYDNKNLFPISASAGVKFWFGAGAGAAGIGGKKGKDAVNINVIDEYTKTPISGVTVFIKNLKNNKIIEGVTQDNGVAVFHKVKAGDYEVVGEILGVQTTMAGIEKTEFKKGSDVNRTLYFQDKRFILRGATLNKNNDRVSNVEVNLYKGDQVIATTLSDVNGNFQFLLDHNTDYKVQGLKEGLYSSVGTVSTKGYNRAQTLFVNLILSLEEVKYGGKFIINDIHYDFDKHNIRPDAAAELNRLVNFLKTNPGVKIELSSHTDSRGDASYNLELSERRAQSAVNYLISKGIDRNRLRAKGYGESRLINECKDGVKCSEAKHQENRRTEILIIE